jgi:glycosyltransferase involved in cell wall biosynthesis
MDSTIELGRGLAEREHNVTIACHPRSKIHDWLGPETRPSIDRVEIRTGFGPHRVLQLARASRRLKPAIVVVDERADVTLSVAARRLAGGFPIVHRYDATIPLTDSRVHRQVWGRELQTLILTSRAIREHLSEAMPWLADIRLEVIHAGKDTGHYRPMPKLRKRMRAELGIPENALVVSYHGTVEEGENLDLLVRAVAELPRHLAVFALIVGVGPQLSEMRRLAAELRAPVLFAGTRTDLPAVLGAADVAAVLSVTPQCSNSVIESLACGLPVIAADTAGHREHVEDGVHGVLVPPQDWNSLADAIRWVSADPGDRQNMARAARERATAEFSLPRMIDRYEEVLRQTVDAFAAA